MSYQEIDDLEITRFWAALLEPDDDESTQVPADFDRLRALARAAEARRLATEAGG